MIEIDVYFTGTAEEWESVTIGEDNKKLIGGWGKANIYVASK